MANQSHRHDDRPSLAQVTRVEPSVSLVPQDRFDLNWVKPLLALPHIRTFRGPSCVAIGDGGHAKIASNSPEGGFGKSLIAVDLVACCIDEVGIAEFLQYATQLRTLRYSHVTKLHSGPREWNICKFIMAIEREVGSHIEELSVTIRELRGSIAPGTASMRGFQRLRKLELPLEIVICNLTAAAACRASTTSNEPLLVGNGSKDHYGLDDEEPFIGDLVPASVSQLSLLSSGTDDHAKALDVMFRHFAARRESTLPALKDLHLSCPVSADDAYKKQCSRLLVETRKVGVVLHLEQWPSSATMTWDGEQ
ncbi:MAG: hypothetical protein Q9201_002873 [Fulgogasparrea decipioides]